MYSHRINARLGGLVTVCFTYYVCEPLTPSVMTDDRWQISHGVTEDGGVLKWI